MNNHLQAKASGETVSVVMLVLECNRDAVFPNSIITQIEAIAGKPVCWVSPEEVAENSEALREAEVIFSTWGAPSIDLAFLERTPNLRAFFYAAGSVKSWLHPETLSRGVTVCSAAAANAVPVAEFTLAVVLLSLKQAFRYLRSLPEDHGWLDSRDLIRGNYGSKVGIVSLGLTGISVVEKLRPFDLELQAYDPFFDPDAARELGVTLVSLEQIFADCDVVSIHTPLLRETARMIDGRLVASMKHGATLINTSRGRVVNEVELYDVLKARPDLSAFLDVTDPEPPTNDSPLWKLKNAFVTPHIAGSLGAECERMSQLMVDEFDRLRKDEPLRHAIQAERLPISA
jgi:phosphoglycerate dehydrogenase-like enzyme